MVDWDSLVNFKTVDDIDMLILKIVYIPNAKALISTELMEKLEMINVTKITVTRKLHKLHHLELINLINTKPLCVNGIPELEKNISNLLLIKSKRKELVSRFIKMKSVHGGFE